MKLNAGKRVLMFFHWLLSLLICAGLVAYLVFPEYVMTIYDKLVASVGLLNMKIIGAAILAIYLILAIVQICMILRRRRRAERGFITVDSSDTGRTRIAISAIEQMVRQSVHSIDGISEMKISIDSKDDSIVIAIVASIVNGCHVPTITMNMQNAIRKFVEMNCGVAVQQVLISINAVTSPSDTPRRRRLMRGKKLNPTVVPATPSATPEAAPAAAAPSVEPVAEYQPPEPVRAAEPVRPEPVRPEPAAPAFEAPAAESSQADPAEPLTLETDSGSTFVIDPDYKPTLTLDPFGDADAPADDEEDVRYSDRTDDED